MQSRMNLERKRKVRRTMSISRTMALTFIGIIAVGTCLLSLPADAPLQFALVPVETLGDDLCVCGTLFFDDGDRMDFEMDYPRSNAP